MRLGSVLVDLDLALQIGHEKLKTNDAREHLLGKLGTQGAPLLCISRFMIGNQFLQQLVFLLRIFNQRRLYAAVHREIVPGRHAQQVRIDGRTQVRVRAHESYQGLRTCLQVAPVRIGFGTVAQQHHPVVMEFKVKRDMTDERQSALVHADQTGQRISAHQRCGVSATLRFELGR